MCRLSSVSFVISHKRLTAGGHAWRLSHDFNRRTHELRLNSRCVHRTTADAYTSMLWKSFFDRRTIEPVWKSKSSQNNHGQIEDSSLMPNILLLFVSKIELVAAYPMNVDRLMTDDLSTCECANSCHYSKVAYFFLLSNLNNNVCLVCNAPLPFNMGICGARLMFRFRSFLLASSHIS